MSKHRNISIFDLMQYRFPVTAIASIFHRITGVILFLYIPTILYFLGVSLHSNLGFEYFHYVIRSTCGSFFFWLFCSVSVYHLIAGFKHLMMDMGFGEDFKTARVMSYVTIVLGIVAAILLGVWVW